MPANDPTGAQLAAWHAGTFPGFTVLNEHGASSCTPSDEAGDPARERGSGKNERVAEPVDSFASNRHFQLWRYTIERGQLLLRSTRDEAHANRIDVLFEGVDHIDLPTSLDEVHVRHDGARFIAFGPGWRGSVTAHAMFTVEDDGENDAASSLFADEP